MIRKEGSIVFISSVFAKSGVSGTALNAASKATLILNGTVVMAGVSINADTRIGFHCIINTNASIDYVYISPNAALAGNVLVKEGAHIGIGASIIQGVKIGRWSTIGAGAVIIDDIPDFAVVVGNPGKVIKFNEKNT